MSPDPLNAQGNFGSQLEVEQISPEIGSVSFSTISYEKKQFGKKKWILNITFIDHIGKILNRMSLSFFMHNNAEFECQFCPIVWKWEVPDWSAWKSLCRWMRWTQCNGGKTETHKILFGNTQESSLEKSSAILLHSN